MLNGKINAMTTTMDSAGRVVLPKAARERAGLVAGMPLEVRVVDGRVEIEPAAARVTVEKKGGVWVATPVEDVPVLRQEDVDRTQDDVRAPGDRAGQG
jgi:AbrB family looped-hinge helix DNA binding protein